MPLANSRLKQQLKSPSKQPPSSGTSARVRNSSPEMVDPRWLLKAGAAVVALGLVCAYASICILFYEKQWELVLHPSQTLVQTPATDRLAFESVRFADDLTGKPELTGWWIPGDSPTDPTVLMLHSGDGSMSGALPSAAVLHDARLNVLLFDYRGYGQSANEHPSAGSMRADAEHALQYLTQQRHLTPSSILVWGSGLGASLAVSLCEKQPRLAGLLLESADGDTETRVLRDQRSRIVPVSLLFHDRFPLADPLHRLRTPKLIISFTDQSASVDAQRAADPKTTVELPSNTPAAELTGVVRRFLDTYVSHSPGLL